MSIVAMDTQPEKVGPRRGSRSGFTIIEAVISMVIVSVMLVAAFNTVGGTAKARLVDASRQRSHALGQQLMAEVLQSHYKEPDNAASFGPEAGETDGSRQYFDDVDDYNNWSSSPPKNREGVAIPNTVGWTQQVSVQYVQVSDPSIGSNSDTGLKKITVTITDPQGRATSLQALRSQSSAFDQKPTVDTTVLSSVAVSLQLGGDSSSGVTSATGLLNRVSKPSTLTAQEVNNVSVYPGVPN